VAPVTNARARSARRFAVLLLALAPLRVIAADAGWFEAGDSLLRLDLQLLNDAGVVRVPIQQWPIPRAAVAYALSHAKEQSAGNVAVAAALARVRARLESRPRLGFAATASAGEAGRVRDFDTLAREDAELGGRVDYAQGRFAAGLSVTGALDPDDGQELRADGSHLTAQLGNWLISANTLDRWWGPGHQGSLILSNNARPMPTFTIERAEARAFEMPLLSWLGPWRFNFAISQMEDHRADVDSPLFMAWRVTVMPFHDIELGFSRTAQFCGEGLECNLDVFGNLLAGNDNVGIDATEGNEPGNQMAGFDLRWNSPIGTLPYAIYSQYIGEDESSYLPAKYLSQFGLEVWKPLGDGGIVQAYVEYSNTTCSAHTSRGPYYQCAYIQGRFDEDGYRYRGRVIGHSIEADGDTYALGVSYTTPRGDLWTATARTAEINVANDSRNRLSPVPADYDALEFGWRGTWSGESLAVELGVESFEPVGVDRDVSAFGFVRWNHSFTP